MLMIVAYETDVDPVAASAKAPGDGSPGRRPNVPRLSQPVVTEDYKIATNSFSVRYYKVGFAASASTYTGTSNLPRGW